MSIEKSKVKVNVINELGNKFDDMLDRFKQDSMRYEGAKSGLKQAAKAIEGLTGHVDRDIKEDKYSIEVAAHVKKYIMHAIGILDNLATTAEISYHRTLGSIEATNTTIRVAKNMMDVENNKIIAQESAVANEEDYGESLVPRATGMHPGNPLADINNRRNVSKDLNTEESKEETTAAQEVKESEVKEVKNSKKISKSKKEDKQDI